MIPFPGDEFAHLPKRRHLVRSTGIWVRAIIVTMCVAAAALISSTAPIARLTNPGTWRSIRHRVHCRRARRATSFARSLPGWCWSLRVNLAHLWGPERESCIAAPMLKGVPWR